MGAGRDFKISIYYMSIGLTFQKSYMYIILQKIEIIYCFDTAIGIIACVQGMDLGLKWVNNDTWRLA